MIEQIVNHLFHLIVDVVEICLPGIDSTDIHPWNFGLDYYAERIRLLIREIIMRIMSQPKEISP